MTTEIIRKDLTPQWALNFSVQQSGHMKGSDIAYDADDNACLVKDQAGNPIIAKAAKSSSAGNLEVHLLNDWDATGLPVWCVKTLVADEAQPMLFDAIRSTGTTVTLADLEIIL